MPRISDLLVLQGVDLEIDALQKTLDELHERGAENEELTAARERVVVLEEQERAVRAEQRGADDDVEDMRARVVGVEQKLYGGAVTNSKELRDLQREQEALQKQLQVREDALFSVLTRLEETQSELRTTREAVTAGEADWQRSTTAAADQATELEALISGLRVRRAAAARPIDGATMALYERLRRMRQGRAVARVQGGTCQGCRISLPSNLFQKARSGLNVVQCSSCERILFVG